MSEENVERVLAAMDRFDEQGGPDPDAWHDDGLLTGPEGWPEPGPFRGRAAIQRQFERLVRDFASFHSTDREVIRAEGDWVVVAFRLHSQGAQSGISGTWDMAVAFKLKNGRFLEAHYRWEPEEALEAAGLAE